MGSKFDTTVHTREGYQWEIAVVWLTSDGKVATVAKAGETYYPTLAFYIAPKYRLASGTLIVSISDSLTRLLGDKNLVSVFDSSTGLTYILPPAASELPTVTNTINKERTTRWQASSGNTPAPASDSTPASGSPTNPEPASDPTPDPEPEPEPEPEKTLIRTDCG